MNFFANSRPLLLASAVLFGTSCDALFGGLTKANPESCVATPTLCKAEEEICNSATRECEPALHIDSISPIAAPYDTEVTVTITGRNFVPDMTLTVAGRPAKSLTLVSPTQLTALLPASSGNKAKVPLALTTPTTQRFEKSDLFHYFPWPTFAAPALQPLSGLIKNARAGDVNGDGRPDVVVAADNGSSVLLFLGQADGTLAPAPAVPFSSRPFFVAVGDLNADGKVDLATSQTGPQSKVEVALGKGDGTFVLAGAVATSVTATSFALVDVNHDRKDDVVIPDGNNITVGLSNGDGTFAAPIQSPHSLQMLDSSTGVATGDLNGDGELDLITANNKETRVGVFLGKGNGSFTEAKSVSNGSVLVAPTLADVSGDQKLDLILLDRVNGLVGVCLGDGKGGFAPVVMYGGPKSSESVWAADVNGDGTIDLVTVEGNGLGETFEVLAGYGDGQFLRSAKYPVGQMALASLLYVGDIDRDNKPDVVIGQRSGKLGLFKNVTP